MEIDWGMPDAERVQRLELVQRMGPAAAGVVQEVIDWGGGPDDEIVLAGWAALDAIDPDRTLRIPVFLAQCGMAGREIDADEGLHSAGVQVLPLLQAVLAGNADGSLVTCCDAAARFGPAAADLLPSLRRVVAEQGDLVPAAAARAIFRISDGQELALPALLHEMVRDPWLFADAVAARPHLTDDLVGQLVSDDRAARIDAARLIAELSPDTPGIAPSLVIGLEFGDRQAAADCRDHLIALGPRAASEIPELVRVLSSRERGQDAAAVLASCASLAACSLADASASIAATA